MIQSHKSSLLVTRAACAVVEYLEKRQMLSATLSASSSLMVFNAVENSSASQVETLTLTDTGDADLTLGAGSITIANDPSSPTQDAARFSLVNASLIPATLAPGASFGLEIDYSAIGVTDLFNSAILDIASNDPVNPTVSVTLHGIGTAGLGGSNQPSLATILQAYDIPTYVGEGFDDANAFGDSVYPYPPDPSSQEVVMQRFVKAGSGPVTIDVLASFTASGAHPYTLGTYTPGNPSSLNQLFTTPSDEDQSTYVQPQGATSFDPGSSEFGFYCVSNVQVTGRIIYSEDSLNTFDSTTGRHFRFFPMEQPNGTIVPDEYIMTSTEWNAPIGYDFTNIVAIVSNITAAASAPGAPVLGLQNLNAEPGSDTMVFNHIQDPNTSIGDQVHNTGVLQVNNTGESPLIISSYTLSSEWTLVNPPTFPVTVAAGTSLDLSIQFVATSEPSVPYNETNEPNYPNGGGVYDGTLVLNSNDPNNPTASVPLAGWWQQHSQNSNEPSLQSLVNLLFGWETEINPTPIPDLLESLSVPSPPVYYGQEVVSGYWAEADPGLSVNVQEIAAWHTQGNSTSTYWFPEGGSKTKLFQTDSDDGQTFFPLALNTNSPAAASFSSSGNFGFWFDTESSVDSLNTSVHDDGGHHVRFYPVISDTGALVPNTYVAAMDYSNIGGQNYDFNDNVYLISNIRPAQNVSGITAPQTTAAPAAPTDLYAVATSGGVSLQWAPIADSTLQGYNIYTSLSANSGFSLLASGVAQTSYLDTTAPAGTAVYYEVAAVDSNGTVSLGTEAGTTTLGTAPTGLTSADIGATPAGSTTVVTPGSAYTVTAGGPGVTGTADGFRFVFEQVTGDFDMKVQVQSITVAGNFSTAGIMARSGLDTGSANVYMSASPVNYRFKDRATEDGTTALTVGGTTSFPGTWVRLARVGDVFNGYSSPDGVNWTLVSTVTLDLPGRLYLGLAVASNDSTQTTTAQLSDFSNTSGGPVTDAYSASAVSGEPTVLNVLSVDTDPTGTIDPTTVTITTPPNQGGQAVVNSSNGTITYTSTPGFTGTETFSYTVGDGSATSQPTLVTITVTPSGLVTNPVTFNVIAGETLLANVLASDTDSTGTINPATLAITGDAVDSNATVVVESGEISYTPNPGFTGTDTVTYTVQDSNGVNSVPTAVTFDVSSSASGPIANPVGATTTSGQSVQINVLASDVSANGLNRASVTVVTAPNHGTAVVNTATGTITYTPAGTFSGTDSFTYTVADDNGVVSQPATVTITVTPVGPVAVDITAPILLGTGSTTVDVLAQAIDSRGTLIPASVTITTAPVDGTATVNRSNGSIVYTPDAGFVGTDTLQYTVGDGVNTSAPATLSVSVGVTINTTTARSISFVDSGGSRVTIALTGAGAGVVYFAGSGTSQNIKGPHGTGSLLVSGSGLGISNMDLTGTTTASSLTISRKGSTVTALGGLTITGSMNRVVAPFAALTGALDISGSASLLQLASASGATINVGTAGAAFTFLAGNVVNTSLTSSTPIKSLKVADWTNTGATDSIIAPSILSLVATGNFQASLSAGSFLVPLIARAGAAQGVRPDLSSGTTSVLLGSVRIGGQIAADPWSVGGATLSIVTGSVAAGWRGDFTAAVNTFTVRAGGFAGTLTAQSINSLSITGNDTGSITAGSIRSARVAGGLNGANLKLTGGVSSKQQALGRLIVTSATTGSTIDSAGNIGSITMAGVSGSFIDAGVNSDVTLPAAATDFSANASIGSFNVTGHGSTFANTDIGANAIGSLSLGEIITASGSTPFGIGAGTIKALSASLNTGGVLRLNAQQLLSSNTVDSYINAHALNLNSFVVRPGL